MKTARRRSGPTRWIVQVGAFQDAALAEAYLREVQRHVDGARIEQWQGWHRIVLGPYKREVKAERLAEDLARSGFHAVLRPASR
jgi:cell division protein FtsN